MTDGTAQEIVNEKEDVGVAFTNSEARALMYASWFGLEMPLARWPDQKYRDTAKRARDKLVNAEASARG